MDPVYKSPVLVLLRNSKERRLVFDGYACEAASEECDLYLLQPSSRKGGQVSSINFLTSSGVTSACLAVMAFWLQNTQSLGQPL